MPRALAFLYTLRNKRGIGHIGGDINPNEIDSATCARIADWCMCELIRTYRSIPIEEAQALLDAISVRQVPEIWNVGGKRRVLDTSLDYKSQVLVLLFGEEQAVPIEDLCSWVDHPRLRDFRRDVLLPLHRERVIEYDAQSETATLSPSGARMVEDRLRPQ